MEINLLKEHQKAAADQANARFHTKVQVAAIILMAAIVAVGSYVK
jgi:hypothetical protein